MFKRKAGKHIKPAQGDKAALPALSAPFLAAPSALPFHQYQVALVFPHKSPTEQHFARLSIEQLQEAGLVCDIDGVSEKCHAVVRKYKQAPVRIVLVTALTECVEQTAEQLNLEMPLFVKQNEKGKTEEEHEASCLRQLTAPFRVSNRLLHGAVHGSDHSYFSPAQLLLLVLHRLQGTACLQSQTDLSFHSSSHKPLVTYSCPPPLVLPLHQEPLRRSTFQLCLRSIWHTDASSQMLRAYYGESVAFYFTWLQCYISWLVGPALAGIVLRVTTDKGVTVDDNPYLPFYGLFMVLWSFAFIKSWHRQQAWWALRWGTLRELSPVANEHTDMRAEFRRQERRDPVTGLLKPHYPQWKRRLHYCVSALVSGAFLMVAFAVMVVSFNLQGYMSDKRSLFHVEIANQFSRPGRVFDPNGDSIWPLWLLPVVLHALCISQLNSVYRVLAEWLTARENHRTESDHRTAMIIKRFLFEAFDAYTPLFYLAFYQLDVQLLRLELVALYSSDSVRRVLVESLLPYLAVAFKIRMGWDNEAVKQQDMNSEDIMKRNKKEDLAQEDDVIKGDLKQRESGGEAQISKNGMKNSTWVLEQLQKEEYDDFDDYLEICIQFGYITLFASAFPLAAALSLVCNIVEIRNDAFKLAFVHRRPAPERAHSIGVWQTVLVCMACLSVITNCMIFGFASDQMTEWFPSLFRELVPAAVQADQEVVFEGGNAVHTEMEGFKDGQGRFAVGLVFALEHALALLCLCLWLAVASWPKQVQQILLQRQYQRSKCHLRN